MDIEALLPVIIPLVLLQAVLFIVALVHILRHDTYKHGNRTLWVLVIFINIIGPVLYFTLGRSEE